MNDRSDFATYARLLTELSPEHQPISAWSDRPDLPEAVRDFWGTVGVSPLTGLTAPAKSRNEDEKRLATVFERWFEKAPTRDRWLVEAQDEPIPWRRLPERPRLVATERERILLASDVEPEPTLHVFTTRSPIGKPVPFGYLEFCMLDLLDRGTTKNCATFFWGPRLGEQPIWTARYAPLSRIPGPDGLFLLNDLPGPAQFGATLIYRDVATYSQFVLSRDQSEQGHFSGPEGVEIDVRLPKALKLEPIDKKLEPGFTLVPQRNPDGKERPRESWHVVGRIEEHWVWIQRLEPRRVGVITELGAAPSVQTWLVARGAAVQETRTHSRTLDTCW